MHISKIKIHNYKCFLDSSELELTPGFNIIAGQNNAGKTAFLEALGLRFSDRPHHSSATIKQERSANRDKSSVDICVTLNNAEFRKLLVPGRAVELPVSNMYLEGAPDWRKGEADQLAYANWLLNQPTYRYRWSVTSEHEDLPSTPLLGLYAVEIARADGNLSGLSVYINEARKATKLPAPTQVMASYEIGARLADFVRSHVYHFKAERFPNNQYFSSPETTLQPNSENLPTVLSNLQSKQVRFRHFNEAVREILPLVDHIGVENIESNRVHVVVYKEADEEHEELGFPLYECGSGIAQVLSILYAVFCTNEPQVLLIDEPQSFLHPGAVRKLIEILKLHPQHQYILATHSPTVITAANPATITVVRQENGVSDFARIDPKENSELRGYLAEIGASLSDVFGADSILWVEGPTEEEAFPLILERVAHIPLMGTAIIGVNHTGDLEGKHKKTAWEIYKRLAKGAGLIPPAVCFLFDRDKLASTKPDTLSQDSSNMIRFLARRMYENYLLDPDAIVDRINHIEGFREKPFEKNDITRWIEDNGKKQKYKGDGEVWDDEWLKTVDGADLLEDLYSSLSETRVQYQKTEDSIELTKWLIEHNREQLREVSDLLVEILKSRPAPA